MSKPPVPVFISYAHKDSDYFEVFKEGLVSHLFTSSKYDFGAWDDSKIHVGSFWDKEIQENLGTAGVAILCVSAHFLNSQYIKAEEFGKLVEKYPRTLIVPVYFNHCNIGAWEQLSERQFFKPPGEKFDQATKDDFAFCDLVKFRDTDGKPNSNANRDLYFQELIRKVEAALSARSASTLSGKPQTKYLNPATFPYFEKDSFFGRDELLKDINTNLQSLDVPLLLSGIGGLGKTAVAIAYGRTPKYSGQYDHIAWVDVTENIFSNLFSSFQKIPSAPFEYNKEGNLYKDIEHMMQVLTNLPGNNLLVIDNANDNDDLRSFINQWKRHQPRWKCLVTTRCEHASYKTHLIRLEFISLEAAEQLFKRHNDETFDKASFDAIYEYVGAHTFLIELLAKFAQESNTINGTLQLLNYLRANSIAAIDKSVVAKRGHLAETDSLVSEFVMSLYDPLYLTEKEQEYLRFFSILPATEIEFSLLQTLFNAENSDKELDDTLNTLAKKGWFIRNQNSFKCHQIIQEITRKKLNPDVDNCARLILRLTDLFENQNVTQVASFFEIGISVANTINEPNFEMALLQFKLAIGLIETGNLSESMNVLEKAREIFSGLNKYNEAMCLSRMGDIYKYQGNFKKAFDCYLQDIKIFKQLTENNPDTDNYKNGLAISYQKLGNIYQSQGDTEKALKYYLQFNEIIKELTKNNSDTIDYKNGLAISYQKLGNIYQSQGDREKALKYYLQFNEIIKELSNNNYDIVEYKNGLSISCHKLGNIYFELGDKDKALEYYLQYNEIKTELVMNYPSIVDYKSGLAISYENLGNVYQSQGDFEKALKYYLQDCTISKELVENNPDIVDYKSGLATSYHKLGNIYLEQGDKEKALEYYLQDCTISKELAENNPDIVGYKNGLAVSYTRLAAISQNDISKEYHLKAQAIWEYLVTRVPQNAEYKSSLNQINNILASYQE